MRGVAVAAVYEPGPSLVDDVSVVVEALVQVVGCEPNRRGDRLLGDRPGPVPLVDRASGEAPGPRRTLSVTRRFALHPGGKTTRSRDRARSARPGSGAPRQCALEWFERERAGREQPVV